MHPGLERRVIELYNRLDSLLEQIYILRIDPTAFRFDVKYDPQTPRSLEQWQAETGALIITNGSYFSLIEDSYIATGLLIIDGQPIGSGYGPFAGMLAITHDGPELRWLEQAPYDPDEPLLAGLQSFPFLVLPGGQLGFSEEHEDNHMARRTVIGQDKSGRFLLLISPQGHFTLHTLSVYLTNSDLDLDIALNLDGGPSSGILLADPAEIFPAQTQLPIVIAIYAR